MKQWEVIRRGGWILSLLFGMVSIVPAQGPSTGQAKAEEILKKARATIASESKFKSLQGMQINGSVRQSFGERQMESELEIELFMPDKVRKSTISSFATIISVLNGEESWNDFVPGMGMGGMGGGQMRAMMGGQAGGNSPMMNYLQAQQKRELVQAMLGLLLLAPPSSQMTYTHLGEAPGPEGTKLDVIDAKASDGMTVRLFFTQEETRLLGLSYKAKQARRGFGGGRPGGGQGGGGAASQGQGQRQPPTPEEREERMRQAWEAFEKSPDVDYRWAFDDYRNVGGFTLPHRITKIEAGTPNEEWTISKIKLNPKLTADKFVKKGN
jgi:outer membrane lipoprotein-sorting protein